MEPQCSTSLTSTPTTSLLSFRVRLSKRRAKAGTQSTTNAVLVCKHRDMNEKELEAQVSVTDTSLNIYSVTPVVTAHLFNKAMDNTSLLTYQWNPYH